VLGERIALYRKVREENGMRFDPMQVVVARQLYIGDDSADIEAARARQNANVQRTIASSRTPDGKGAQAGAHVLAYADKGKGATEEHALYGTGDEVAAQLDALRKAGVHYIMFNVQGGVGQLQRFARELMPAFGSPRAQAAE
jgi:alkanesulfonate monooxygenase SsuD/methylene tetrahydromethanopterin reductase-like flavin-dependent oxidoreductase (luciferase family)